MNDERKLTTEFVKGVFSRYSPTWNGADFDVWLRAVEVAVRADQIEKDAAIAEKQRPWNYTRPDDWTERAHSRAVTANEAAAAIRAQLTEGNGDE